MRSFALALLLAFALPAANGAQAQSDSRLSTLSSRNDGRGFQAVGRLNLDGRGFCTATLISDTRVLTAAHCLFDRASGTRLDDTRIEFLAGWRSGRAEAIRGVARSAIAPDFSPSGVDGTADLAMIPGDIAVLELDRPIRTTAIAPIALAPTAPSEGSPVTVVSYARGRSEAPSIQETCHVLEQRPDRITVMSCDIDFGSSGAPVLANDGRGGTAIVSVISARAEGSGGALSLGMRLTGRIEALQAQLDAGLGPSGAQGARTTARFVRP